LVGGREFCPISGRTHQWQYATGVPMPALYATLPHLSFQSLFLNYVDQSKIKKRKINFIVQFVKKKKIVIL
jgi:hypothetical protein